jgi:hypothetical protein
MKNADIEALWVDAWDTLLAMSKGRHGFRCMLPDGSVVDVDACLGWLQESVYSGYRVSVQNTWLFGTPGALVSRSLAEAPNPTPPSS